MIFCILHRVSINDVKRCKIFIVIILYMAGFNRGPPAATIADSPLVRTITKNGQNPVYPQFHFVYTHGNCLVNSNDALSCWRIPDNTRLIWFSLVPLGRVSILGPASVQFIYDEFYDEFLKPGIIIDTDAKFIELIKRIKTKIYLELLKKILKIQNQVDNIVSKINTAKEQIKGNIFTLAEQQSKIAKTESEYFMKQKEIDKLEAEIAELDTKINEFGTETEINSENNKKRKHASQIFEFKKETLEISKEILKIILENFKRSLNETGEIELENKIAEHTISSNEPDLRDYLNYGQLLLEEPDKILECRIYNSGESAPQKYYTTDTDLLEESNGGKDWNIVNVTSPNPIYSNSLPRENKPGSDVPIPMFKREDVDTDVETNIQEIVTMKPGLHIVVDSSCSSVFHEENPEQEITSASAIAKHNSQCGKGMSINIVKNEAVGDIQHQIRTYFNRLINQDYSHLFPAGGYRNKKQQTKITKRTCKKCKKMKTKRRKYKSGKNKNKNKNKTKRKGKTKKKQSRKAK